MSAVADTAQETTDPVDANPELTLASLLPLASLPSLARPQVAESLDEADRAYREAWQCWARLYERLPDSWSRLRVVITGVLRHVERARGMQQMGNAAAAELWPADVINPPELFVMLRETHRQYWAAIDSLLENATVTGDLLSARDRAQLLQECVARVEARVETLRDARNAAVSQAITEGATVSGLAARLKVTRAAINKMLAKAKTAESGAKRQP